MTITTSIPPRRIRLQAEDAGHPFHGNQWTGAMGSGNHQTDNPKFKAWFGDSKVVDKDGKPKMLFHGSTADFSEFNPSKGADAGYGAKGAAAGKAIFLGDEPEHASYYAQGEGGNITPAFVKMENPFRPDASFGKNIGLAIWEAKQNGHDGVIMQGPDDPTGKIRNIYVAFHPTQIKSAIGNSGNWNPKDARITASASRRPAAELRASNPEGINQWTVSTTESDGVNGSKWTRHIASDDKGKKLGELETKFNPERNEYQVHEVRVDESNRGKGIGKSLYKSAFVHASKTNSTVRSDAATSSDADHVWSSLKKQGFDVVRHPGSEMDSPGSMGKLRVFEKQKFGDREWKLPTDEPVWRLKSHNKISARRAVSQHPLEAAAGPLPGQIERVIVSLQNDGHLPIRIPPETMRHVAESLARYFQTASKDKIEQFAEAAKAAVEAELKTENIQTHDTMKADTTGVNVGNTPATSRAALSDFIESATGDNIGGLMNMDFFNRIMREVTQGAGNFVAQNFDQTRLDEFPALELHRVYDREVPRGLKVGKGGAILPDPDNDWPSRWEAAGGELVDGRMVALKSDPIWQAIGDGDGGYDDTLGNPFAPFAFNSGFDTDEVSREDAVALGLMDDEDEAKPADFDFTQLLNIEAASAAVSTQPGGQTLENGSRRAALGIQAAAGDVPLVVKCFITDADGRLLVLQADGYGRIDLPGGHLRAGETVEDGLRREVLEETGMTLTDVKELGTVLVPWNGQQPIVFFSAHADTDAPLALSDEHVDWFWLNRHEVALRNFSALTKPVANFMNGQPLEAGAPVATMALEAGDVEGHEFHGNQYTGKGGPPEKMDNKELRFRRDDAASAARMYPDEKEEHLKNHAILESEMKRRGMMTNVSSSIGHYRSDIGKKSKIR